MIKWGVIGFGRMGKQYVNCLKVKSDLFKLSGVSSKTSSRIKEFDFYKTYEELIKLKEIDAIYISTLNNTHNELIKQILKRDKKILCEKPLTTSLNKLDQIKNDLNKPKSLSVKNHKLKSLIKFEINDALDEDINKIFKFLENNY